jgi:hypothetical protein
LNPGAGRDFPHPSIPTPRLTPPLVQWVLVLFPGGKATATVLTPRLIKRRALYYFGPSRPVIGQNVFFNHIKGGDDMDRACSAYGENRKACRI